jgi:two-component system sensor histidine kinase YesM
MTELFLEGYTYTLSGVGGASSAQLTPASERLLGRVNEEFNAPSLLKLSKRQAQYRALQSQINPHFLYNTLESIRSEALIAGLGSVADMTEALAIFFRYTISKVEDLVSVEEELENCDTYFRIQQYRFGARLCLHIECDARDRDEIYRCRLPKLTLQPILENSVIHGTESKIGAGHISVRLERRGKRLRIPVSDVGGGMDGLTLAQLNERLDKSGSAFQGGETDQGGSVALVNVNNRIHLLFGEEYGLHVYSMPGVGTDVQIILPMITSDREILAREAAP